MWTRSELKSQAKANLRNKYWIAFVVALITGLLGAGSNIFSMRFDSGASLGIDGDSLKKFQSGDIDAFMAAAEKLINSGILLIILFFAFFAMLMVCAFRLFVSTVVQVGGNRWFSRSRETAATPSVGLAFSLFKAGSYLKTVGSMLWMNLFLFFWGLLASVPSLFGMIYIIGKATKINFHDYQNYQVEDWVKLSVNLLIDYMPYLVLFTLASILFAIPLYIKTYSYRMTPWILADNPQIGFRRSLQLSRELTRGHKWSMFILDLSFIGWFLLGSITFGIGILFVMPYYLAVQAELFAALRTLGVNSGFCTMEEFGYVKVEQPSINPAVPAAPVAPAEPAAPAPPPLF